MPGLRATDARAPTGSPEAASRPKIGRAIKPTRIAQAETVALSGISVFDSPFRRADETAASSADTEVGGWMG